MCRLEANMQYDSMLKDQLSSDFKPNVAPDNSATHKNRLN